MYTQECTQPCFVCWKGTLEGTLPHFTHYRDCVFQIHPSQSIAIATPHLIIFLLRPNHTQSYKAEIGAKHGSLDWCNVAVSCQRAATSLMSMPLSYIVHIAGHMSRSSCATPRSSSSCLIVFESLWIEGHQKMLPSALFKDPWNQRDQKENIWIWLAVKSIKQLLSIKSFLSQRQPRLSVRTLLTIVQP